MKKQKLNPLFKNELTPQEIKERENFKTPAGWLDWNTLSFDEMVNHLEEKYKFQSTSDAKCTFSLIDYYRRNLKEKKSVFAFEYTPDKNEIGCVIMSLHKTKDGATKAMKSHKKKAKKDWEEYANTPERKKEFPFGEDEIWGVRKIKIND